MDPKREISSFQRSIDEIYDHLGNVSIKLNSLTWFVCRHYLVIILGYFVIAVVAFGLLYLFKETIEKAPIISSVISGLFMMILSSVFEKLVSRKL